jgi:hypothetical protein
VNDNNSLIRTPSSVALELKYATARRLTYHERAYLDNYECITARRRQASRYFARALAGSPQAIMAAEWSATQAEHAFERAKEAS